MPRRANPGELLSPTTVSYRSCSKTVLHSALVGQKIFGVVERPDDDDYPVQYSWYLRILDFSRRQKESTSTETTKVRYRGSNDPTCVVAGRSSPFTEDVVTALPYYEMMRPVPDLELETQISWKFDQNAFIGVETIVDNSADDTLTTTNFTTYRF
ncbi:hypothetical protein BJ165DRAFT_175695 [Panaeolus papilionaceus]|nr:hypothetical protein BJ165DRAFT_175695 [Panaeolus papilionaceus]